MKRQSKRFTPSKWAEWIVPIVLIILLLALLLAIGLVFLSMFRVV